MLYSLLDIELTINSQLHEHVYPVVCSHVVFSIHTAWRLILNDENVKVVFFLKVFLIFSAILFEEVP